MSQAEHDASSQSILITDDAGFADQVAAAAERALALLPRRAIAARSWNDFGAIIVVESWRMPRRWPTASRPEHLEIATADPDALAARVRHCRGDLPGRHTPEAMGDYIAGPNHVLPTSRTARFSSGPVGAGLHEAHHPPVADAAAIAALGPEAITLAEAEGLDAHARFHRSAAQSAP